MQRFARAVYAVIACLSVTHQYRIKMAKHRITDKCHSVALGFYFSDAKDLSEIRTGSPPMEVPNAGSVDW